MHLTQAGFLTKIVVATILTCLAGSLLTVVGDIQNTEVMRDQLQREVQALEEINEKMEQALEYKDDPEMMERVARDRGYIKENESIFMDMYG